MYVYNFCLNNSDSGTRAGMNVAYCHVMFLCKHVIYTVYIYRCVVEFKKRKLSNMIIIIK